MPAPLRIALAPGDGIGPEIMHATLDLFKAAGVMDHVEFIPVEMGRAMFDRGSTRGMSDDAIRTVEDCGLLFKGPMETPKGSGGKSINVTARKIWNAFANLRHFVALPGVETIYTRAGIPVNFYIVRENLEDTYGGVEQRLSNDTIQCKRLITAPGSDQVSRFAFQTARRLGLKSLHCGHKANIMKMTDGLFLDRFKAAAKDFPEIQTADVIIDALCMNLVVKPQQYQMIVLPNLQGDIVSDLAAGLVGGLGFAPSANIGKHISIFEAVHGSAPDIAGRGIANPTALMLSGLMMLRHIGLTKHAGILHNALMSALESGIRTGDFGDPKKPALGTREFSKAIADRLGSKPRTVPPADEPDSGGAQSLWNGRHLTGDGNSELSDLRPHRFAGLDFGRSGNEQDSEEQWSAWRQRDGHRRAVPLLRRVVIVANHGGNAPAGIGQGQRKIQKHSLRQQPEAARPGRPPIFQRQQGSVPFGGQMV